MRSVEDFLSEHPLASDQASDHDDTGDVRHIRGRKTGVGETSRDDRNDRSPAAGGTPADGSADLDDCRESALRLLDAAARPSGALRRRLIAKGYQSDVVDDVIGRLERVDLLDDRQYALSAVRYCTARMMGFRGTVMELIRKGVDRSLAEQVAREANDDGAFTDAAWELGRHVAAKTRGLDPQVRQRRFWSAGGRKGHDPETLHEVAREFFDTRGA